MGDNEHNPAKETAASTVVDFRRPVRELGGLDLAKMMRNWQWVYLTAISLPMLYYYGRSNRRSS